jgi:hypothetical protein
MTAEESVKFNLGIANATPYIGSPEPEIKRCPFCDGPAKVLIDPPILGMFGGTQYAVRCSVCNNARTDWAPTKENAIACWNHRPRLSS